MTSVRIEDEQDIEDAIDIFMEKLMPHHSYIAELAKEYDVAFWVSIYPDSEQFGIRLSKEMIERLQVMKISFDFSITYLKSFYNGDYLSKEN